MKVVNLSNINARIRRRKGMMIARRLFITLGTTVNVGERLSERRILGSEKEVGICGNK